MHSHRPAASQEEMKTFAPADDCSLETGNEKLADEIDFFSYCGGVNATYGAVRLFRNNNRHSCTPALMCDEKGV